MQDKGGQTDRLSFTSGELSIISHITCFVSKVEVSGEKKEVEMLMRCCHACCDPVEIYGY